MNDTTMSRTPRELLISYFLIAPQSVMVILFGLIWMRVSNKIVITRLLMPETFGSEILIWTDEVFLITGALFILLGIGTLLNWLTDTPFSFSLRLNAVISRSMVGFGVLWLALALDPLARVGFDYVNVVSLSFIAFVIVWMIMGIPTFRETQLEVREGV